MSPLLLSSGLRVHRVGEDRLGDSFPETQRGFGNKAEQRNWIYSSSPPSSACFHLATTLRHISLFSLLLGPHAKLDHCNNQHKKFGEASLHSETFWQPLQAAAAVQLKGQPAVPQNITKC